MGYGDPIVAPPGSPPLVNDPTENLHEGDPTQIPQGLSDINDYQKNAKNYGTGAYFNWLPGGGAWSAMLAGQVAF